MTQPRFIGSSGTIDDKLDRTVQTGHDNIEKFDRAVQLGRFDAVKAAKDEIHGFLPKDGAHVLDIGIAGGYSTRELSQRFKHTTGVSIEQGDVDHAQKHGLKAIVSDMHSMPMFCDESHDGIFASHVLEHSPAPFVVLTEFHRILKKNGWLFLVLPERDGIAGKALRRIGWFGNHLFCADPQTIIYMLRIVGFHFEWYREVPQFDPRMLEPGMYHQIYLARKGRRRNPCSTST